MTGRPGFYTVADDAVWVDAAEVAIGSAQPEPVAWVCTSVDPMPRELRDWAWLIWQCAIDGGTVDDIVAALAADRPLPERGAADVAEFLARLEDLGLLVRRPEGGRS